MFKLFSARFWDALASIILRNRLAILLLIGLCTLLMTTQWSKMRFTYTEANLLPDDHPVNLKYNDFLEIFGEEGNLIVLGVKDSLLFSVENLNAWNRLSKSFENNPYVETVVTLQDLKKLVKNKQKQQFDFIPFIKDSLRTVEDLGLLKSSLLKDFPFYDNVLFNKDGKAIRSAIFLKKSIVNTAERKTFIVQDLIPKIDAFENRYGIDVRVSGMPYVRTLNSQNIIDEIEIFIIAAILVTSLIFFFFL